MNINNNGYNRNFSLQRVLERIQNNNQQNDRELQNAREIFANLENENNRIENENNRIENENNQLRARVTTLKTANDILQQLVTEVTEQNAVLTMQNNNLQQPPNQEVEHEAAPPLFRHNFNNNEELNPDDPNRWNVDYVHNQQIARRAEQMARELGYRLVNNVVPSLNQFIEDSQVEVDTSAARLLREWLHGFYRTTRPVNRVLRRYTVYSAMNELGPDILNRQIANHRPRNNLRDNYNLRHRRH